MERNQNKNNNYYNDKPTTVMPLGVEPSKPRAIWDRRFVNEHCKNITLIMDCVKKVAEFSWKGAYLFKLDHKNGFQHIPIHEHSRKLFGIFRKGRYNVFIVLPFGWKSCPYI